MVFVSLCVFVADFLLIVLSGEGLISKGDDIIVSYMRIFIDILY
jgi:hypothetical protein